MTTSSLSQVVLYHDQLGKNVWRSGNEGKSWEIVDGVPMGQSLLVVEHPYDSKIVRRSTHALYFWRY